MVQGIDSHSSFACYSGSVVEVVVYWYSSIVLALPSSTSAVTALGVQQERRQCCVVGGRRTHNLITMRTAMWQRQSCHVRRW